jgi:F-type H+-transporting ATPase subunit delta
MGNRTMAVRYARALADVVSGEADLQRVSAEMQQVRDLLRADPQIARGLLAAAMPTSRRKATAEKAFGAAGLHPACQRLLVLLAEKGDLDLLDDVTEAFTALADERRRIVGAEVTTAVPIPAAKADDYRRSLEQMTGRTVRLNTRIDPAILGGVVTRIGSEVYDGSLRSQLRRLHQRLKGE